MSSICKRMSKKIKESALKFPTTMYTTALGSVVICGYIFSEDKESFDFQKTRTLWKKIEKNPQKYVKFGLDDEHFIKKALNLFGLGIPKSFPIAMVQSKFNILFAPYIKGELYPLREDGFVPQSYKSGKVYPLNFQKTEEVAEKQ